MASEAGLHRRLAYIDLVGFVADIATQFNIIHIFMDWLARSAWRHGGQFLSRSHAIFACQKSFYLADVAALACFMAWLGLPFWLTRSIGAMAFATGNLLSAMCRMLLLRRV